MESLNCSICRELVGGGLAGLVRHFTGIHGVTINRGMGNLGFECGQDGCRYRFTQFNSLRRHIRKHHLIKGYNQFREAPEQVLDFPHTKSTEDDIEIVENDTANFDESPAVDCDFNGELDFDFRTFVIGMIARLQCKDFMTGHTLTQVLDECEELLFQTRDFLKAKVKQILQEKAVLNELGMADVLQVFEFDSPFHGLKTLDQQIEALKDNCEYIEPIETPSVYRVNNALDHETDQPGDRDGYLKLTNDDLLQLKIKLDPHKNILRTVKEIKERENVLLGSYTVEGNGTLQRMCSNTLESASTSKKSSSEKLNVPSSPSSQFVQFAESSQSSIASKTSADSYSRYSTVREVLMNHPQGKPVLKAAQTSFSEENRRALIRILVSELVEVHDSHYPPEQAKIALAMAIVNEFPLLKDGKSAKGYEHYYDSLSKRGFIEYRLWTMRKNLSPTKKKYNASDRKRNIASKKQSLCSTLQQKLLTKQELDEKVSWMKCKNPTDDNKSSIISCLRETMANRQDWISVKNPTISEIFDKYPRLLDYKGEMIDLEFGTMFEGSSNNFLTKFPSYYTPRILAYSLSHRPELYKRTNNINNDDLRALVILVQLLPVTNAQKKRKAAAVYNEKKGKRKITGVAAPDDLDEVGVSYVAKSAEIPNTDLIQTVQEGENLQNIERGSRTNVQPYMIRICGQENETFFVQCNGRFINAHDKGNPIIAFDLLFKCFNVLNVSYPASLQNFYNFMDSYVYKTSSQTQSFLSSVHINIVNAKLEKTTSNAKSNK